MDITLSDEQLKEAIKEVDSSGNGKIEFEEFYAFVKKLQSLE